jgi:CubicO group peptidase (beta-lactamase class C family)
MPGGGVEIHGHCDARYEPVREAFAENFRLGLEVGASVCVTERGRTVVDLWGGHADEHRTTPWEKDTIVIVYSTSKIMIALCGLMLVDRGLVDLDAPVAKYWPEFAEGGKEALPVRYLFSHAAGLPSWDEPLAFEDLFDWDRVVGMLARQQPWWEPGTASGYHMLTMGFLLGELVRRVTGTSIGTFFRTRVAEPLGADFHIGLAPEHQSRASRIVIGDSRILNGEPGSMADRVLNNPPVQHWGSRASRAAEIPSANGHGNARGIARVGSAIAMGGELDGVRLVARDTLDRALEEQIYVRDLVIEERVRWGLGMGLDSDEFPCPNPSTLHWGGFGGSFCLMDLDAGVCCAYAMNHMLGSHVAGDPRNERIQDALFPLMRAGFG